MNLKVLKINIEIFKKIFMAAYRVSKNPKRLTQPIGNFNELEVYHDNDILCMKNAAFAAIVSIRSKPSLVLVVDDNFFRLGHDSQNFLLYHEYGHYINKHICYGQKSYKRNIKHEIEADRVGIENTSRDVATKVLKLFYDTTLEPKTKKELETRLKTIMEEN